ncbi:MAG: bifunctional riboflavin kinase/FAD synthetase [Polyangiaceae bacterium]|nr:bifunctional riboflavin kinase/FAD synthetase [Polyangiaceae bacterium]
MRSSFLVARGVLETASILMIRELQATTIAIGNFDGVHRGHQSIIRQARAIADAHGLACVALTFDPHPSEVLGRGAPARLTTLPSRIELLVASGAHRAIVLPFTKELASFTPEKFAHDLLHERLLARIVVVGENFRFGCNRAGNFDSLRTLGAKLGFSAMAADIAGDESGRFSSSRVRSAIAAGDIPAANTVLGRMHAVTGVVEQGDMLGRTIGFRTANLGGIVEMLPPHGVYAVWVTNLATPETTSVPGVMNIGVRPTVDGTKLRVEVHLLEGAPDLYGVPLRAYFVERLRGEVKLGGLHALKTQIEKDIVRARSVLRIT